MYPTQSSEHDIERQDSLVVPGNSPNQDNKTAVGDAKCVVVHGLNSNISHSSYSRGISSSTHKTECPPAVLTVPSTTQTPRDLLKELGSSSIYAVVVRSLSHKVYVALSISSLALTITIQFLLLFLLLSAAIPTPVDDQAASNPVWQPSSGKSPMRLEPVDVLAVQLKVMQLHACSMQQMLESKLNASFTSAAGGLLSGCDKLLEEYNSSVNSPASVLKGADLSLSPVFHHRNNSSNKQQEQNNTQDKQNSSLGPTWADGNQIIWSYKITKTSPLADEASRIEKQVGPLVYSVMQTLYPGTTAFEAFTTFFATIVAMFVLSVQVYAEAEQACQLAYVVAVYCQIIPEFWLNATITYEVNRGRDGLDYEATSGTGQHNDGTLQPTASVASDRGSGDARELVVSSLLPAKGKGKLRFMLLSMIVPVLQLIICLLTFAAGALLMGWMQFSSSPVQILINSVALSFILNFDNDMGGLLAPHVAAAASSSHRLARKHWKTVRPAQGEQRRLGLMYYSLHVLLMACLLVAVIFAPLLILYSMTEYLPSAVRLSAANIHAFATMFLVAHFVLLSEHHPLFSSGTSQKLSRLCILIVTYVSAAVAVIFALIAAARSSGRSLADSTGYYCGLIASYIIPLVLLPLCMLRRFGLCYCRRQRSPAAAPPGAPGAPGDSHSSTSIIHPQP